MIKVGDDIVLLLLEKLISDIRGNIILDTRVLYAVMDLSAVKREK